MSIFSSKKHTEYRLPPSVITKLDMSNLLADAERVDAEITDSEVRARVSKEAIVAPRFSDQLEDFLHLNELSFEDTNKRIKVIAQLRRLKESAPVIHMTFAATADNESLQRIAGWLRESVHPQVLIFVGVNPGLIAGVYMRTPNQIHDMSLRGKLVGQRDLLRKELEAIRG